MTFPAELLAKTSEQGLAALLLGAGLTVSGGALVASGTGVTPLTDAGVKTANYTATANQLVRFDCTSGALALTLPTAPAVGTRVVGKKLDSSANALTVQRGGSDVFNVAGGSTSLTLAYQFSTVEVEYIGSNIWVVTSTDPGAGGVTPSTGLLKANNLNDVASSSTALSNLGGQPLDSDLTAIAALTTTSFGRALLALADASAMRTAAGLGTIATAAAPSGTVVGTSDTQTLTNKRVTRRVGSTASSSTPTPDADANDVYKVTALAANATFGAPTGTPTAGQGLIVRVKDNGTARTLAFNAAYRFGTDLPAPTTTVVSKTMYLGFIWNSDDSVWDCIAQVGNI